MSYYNSLAFHLRQRRLPDERVVEIMADVAEVARTSGKPPTEEFGSPVDYARAFEKGDHRSAGSQFLWGCVLVALAVFTLNVVLDLTTGRSLSERLGSVPVFVYLGLLLLLANLTGMLIDRRLPSQFDAHRA